MSIILSFITIAVLTCWIWLWRHRVTDKPWATVGLTVTDDRPFDSANKVGLGFFLAVVTSLFALFVSAYFIRMELSDWTPLQEPGLLWFNTVMLILGSIAIQWASYGAQRNRVKMTKNALLATGIFTAAFIAGQLWAWQQLVNQGNYINSNPATAFFYVITALHGLHILGGMWVWSRTTLNVWLGAELLEIKLSVQLCRTYWHYLLIMWLALFGLLLST